MHDITEDEVIALVHEAASGQQQWSRALEAVRRSLDCLLVQIVGVDLRHGQLLYSFESEGVVAEALIDYASTYHRCDPHAGYVASRAIGQLISFSRVFDQAFVNESAFYQDFLIPYGSRHMHGAKLYEDDGVATLLGIHRGVGQQPLDGNEWHSAQRICFHLTRAAKVFAKARKGAIGGAVAQDLLNRLAMPVFLVEAHGQVVMLNNAARTAQISTSPLRVRIDGMLECTDLEADQKIMSALVALNSVASAESHKPLLRRTVARINRGCGLGNYLLGLHCIRPDETMCAFGQKPMLMITQHEIGMTPQLDPFLLASAFDLTPAEAMVASAIASGLSYKEVANRKDVSLHTVQAQMKSIYGKLGVRKSTELVALLRSI